MLDKKKNKKYEGNFIGKQEKKSLLLKIINYLKGKLKVKTM